jgi:V/A-type H+/Na+-transporting ATPase subunit C
VTLNELVRQPDVRAVIDLLATWGIVYAKPLTEKFPEYFEKSDLALLECALDKYYYKEALDSVKITSYNTMLIRDILATEIDVVNLKTIFRMIRDRVDSEEAQEFLIEGGKELTPKKINQLVVLHSIGEVIKELEQTPYRFLADVPEIAIKTQKISVIEKQLEKFLIKKGVSGFSGNPLSVASVIGYFWAKYNEVTNIRIISRCKTVDLPDEQLKEELVYV